MAVYAYKALDVDATPLSGTIVADTPRQARDELRGRGLTITEVAEFRQGAAHRAFFARRRGRAAEREVVAFIRELATLLRAGIPLHSALGTLAAQHKRHFRAVVEQLGDQVAQGTALAEAMSRQGEYFDELCVSVVRVGETTGSLDVALRRLADFKEKALRLQSRVITALLYPSVVTALGLAVSVFLMTYVVPGLLSTLVDAGKELPAVTRLVKAVSDLLLHWWWLLIAAVVVAAAAARSALRTERGHAFMDRLMLRLPVIGDLVRKETTSRMAVVMAALLRSGLVFVEAIQITRRTMKNRVFRRAMDEYEAAVKAGRDVAAPLAASGVFSPMVVQMLAVGQQSGELEEMLEQLAESYDQEVAVATQRLTALLEPLLIVLLAVMIGLIAFATILPILEMSNVM
jgi:type IV pilus assembly protein PilC